MAKHNSDERHSDDRVEAETGGVEEIQQLVEFDLPGPTVQTLVLLKDVTLKVVGPVTGNLYLFSGAGAMVDVAIDDVPGLLAKKNPSSCCGVGGPTPYFDVVGG